MASNTSEDWSATTSILVSLTSIRNADDRSCTTSSHSIFNAQASLVAPDETTATRREFVRILSLSFTKPEVAKKLYIPTEIWLPILDAAFDSECHAGYTGTVHSLVFEDQNIRNGLLHQDALYVFWKQWWSGEIINMESKLERYRKEVVRPREPTNSYDEAMLAIRPPYEKLMASWTERVLKARYSDSKWRFWVAEWLLEKLERMVPIKMELQELDKLDGVWPQMMALGIRLASEIKILWKEIKYARNELDWVGGLSIAQGLVEPPKTVSTRCMAVEW